MTGFELAAARLIYAVHRWKHGGPDWNALPTGVREVFLREAREAADRAAGGP